MRPRDRRAIQTRNGVRMEQLSSGAKQLESTICHVQPGAGSDGTYSHEGEEFLYVVTGTLELWLDEFERYTLRAGDSLWFESTHGHRWYNPSSEETVLLWVNTPPTLDHTRHRSITTPRRITTDHDGSRCIQARRSRVRRVRRD